MRKRRVRPVFWEHFSDEQLLDLRFQDLCLSIEGSQLESLIARVRRELSRRGLRFSPHFWVSTEWFTPSGVPGIAVPFYLLHPRLEALEKRLMHQAEGARPASCLRILRHEVGHAVQNVYRLHRLSSIRRVFGDSDTPYPGRYAPRPYSRKFVRHLGMGYAQSHPDEDFAETFAVWLTPGLNWRRRYAGWPALAKLELLDNVMKTVAGRPPCLRNRREVEPLDRNPTSLRRHYARRRRHFGLDEDRELDRRLRALFPARPIWRAEMTAEAFLRKMKKGLLDSLSTYSGKPRYLVGSAVDRMIRRARELELRVEADRTRPGARLEAQLALHARHVLRAHRYLVAI